MSDYTIDELNAYGRAGQGAADAAAAQTIAASLKSWKVFLGGTGSLLMQTSSVWWNAGKWMTVLPVPPEWQFGMKVAMSVVPAAFKVVTDKAWRESVKTVVGQTVKTVGNYARKLQKKVKEAAQAVVKGTRKAFTTIKEKVTTIYTSVRIEVVNAIHTVATKTKALGKRAAKAMLGFFKRW